jgi:hypothetical protein
MPDEVPAHLVPIDDATRGLYLVRLQGEATSVWREGASFPSALTFPFL